MNKLRRIGRPHREASEFVWREEWQQGAFGVVGFAFYQQPRGVMQAAGTPFVLSITWGAQILSNGAYCGAIFLMPTSLRGKATSIQNGSVPSGATLTTMPSPQTLCRTLSPIL